MTVDRRRVPERAASPLEETYRQLFNVDPLTPPRLDQSFFSFPYDSWNVSANRYVTYVTYGVCEDPIMAR